MSEQQQSHEVNSLFGYSMANGSFYNFEDNPDTVKRYIKDPMTYYRELRRISRKLYSANGVYTNVVDYMTALPTLDRVVFAKEGRKKAAKSKKKNSVQRAEQFLNQIRDKSFMRDVIHGGNIDGEYFAYLRMEQSDPIGKTMSDMDVNRISEINEIDLEFNASLMPLPTDYCRIVGRRNSSYVVAFDLRYFDGLTDNKIQVLKTYPKEFMSAYLDYSKTRKQSGQWLVLDVEKTFSVKLRAKVSEQHGRPIGLAAFKNMTYQDTVLETKQRTLDEVNGELIIQTFPEGEKKGQSSLTQAQQKAQHEFVRDAVGSKRTTTGTRVISVAAGTDIERLETNTDILNVEVDHTGMVSSDLGFASSLLNGKDGNYSSQQGNSSLVAAQVFQIIEQAEYELNKLINANVVKESHFSVKVSYLPITHLNRKEQVQNAKELYTLGRGSLLAWIAATGMNPDVYMSLMDYELENDFESKYPIHQTSFTATSESTDGEDKGGRPEEEDTTNPSTLKNKTNGSGQE